MQAVYKILLGIFIFIVNSGYGQNIAAKKIILKAVFDNIVNAYGNAKAPPALELIASNKTEHNPAFYISTPIPTIKVEEQAFDICMQFGKDSLNALSIILSHELAHYYNDHGWCSDYAFAIKNSALGKKLRDQSKGDIIKYETQADNYGFYYSAIAGYAPFDIFDNLIDKIYSGYKLPDNVFGYPGKEERKMIGRQAQEKISQLYPVFEVGTILTYAGKYEEAIECFKYLCKFFPSRENYNNLGVARLLLALKLKPLQAVEFIYPVEIDMISRLQISRGRGPEEDNQVQMTSLLQAAKKDFELAISLDPVYTFSYINLACVYDLMGNYEAAIGRINEMPLKDKNAISALEIKAIAYAHAENDKKANEVFKQIEKLTNDAGRYNYKIFTLSQRSMIESETFKQQWLNKISKDSALLVNVTDDIVNLKKTNTKEFKNEVVTQINETPLFVIKSSLQKANLHLKIIEDEETINIHKWLLPKKTIYKNTQLPSWKILNEKPFIILQLKRDNTYVITF